MDYTEGQSIDHFCNSEIEPIDKEADQIQIIALINSLELTIKIVYLDANVQKKEPQILQIPEDSKQEIFIELLYRPGHYDILYK